jgi:hypothetical protein
MKEFGLTPEEWGRISRADRKMLQYYLVMEEYYMDRQFKKQRAQAEKKEGIQKFLNSMPRLKR